MTFGAARPREQTSRRGHDGPARRVHSSGPVGVVIATLQQPSMHHSLKVERERAEHAAAGGTDKRDYVRSVFQRIAPRYDLLNHLLSVNIDKRWRRLAIARLDWRRQPDRTYLDLCAGTMDVSVGLQSAPGFTGSVIAADFAERMLRAGMAKRGARVVSPVVSDALQLPLDDGSVAGAIVAFGLRNLVDVDAGLREARRVIAPGGRFVVLEFSTPPSAAVRRVFHAYFHHVLPFLGGAISGHRGAYQYLPRSVSHFPSASELAQRMRDAGFSHVEYEMLTLGIAAIHVGVRGG